MQTMLCSISRQLPHLLASKAQDCVLHGCVGMEYRLPRPHPNVPPKSSLLLPNQAVGREFEVSRSGRSVCERKLLPPHAVPTSDLSGLQEVGVEEEDGYSSDSPATAQSGSKLRGSAQLSRWARARRIRSGKLSDRKSDSSSSPLSEDGAPAVAEAVAAPSEAASPGLSALDRAGSEDGPVRERRVKEKAVYMVSDGTGWTADHSVHAALGQFEHCLVDQGCAVNTRLFSEVTEVEQLMKVIRQAAGEGALLVYTLADPSMAEVARQTCQMLQLPHVDILGPITEALGTHLGVTPLGLPRGAVGRLVGLSKQYFKRIEAVEFTIKQDDGALPKNLHLADMVLVGVSRTSKTPLSIYMAQKGYKVANVPLVLGIKPPKELFEVDQDKIYALTINPNYLKTIRVARQKHLGTGDASTAYTQMNYIRKELEESTQLFQQNPIWPVIEVTGKAIEESAASILRIYHDRQNKFAMPHISRRY